jgi:hypothetical protein
MWRAAGLPLLGLVVALGGLLWPLVSGAETVVCSATTAGQQSVQANIQCECRFFPASGLRGTPAGHRWDCGILRARNNQDVPATANPYPYPLPAALSLDRAVILNDGRLWAQPR